MLFFLLRLPHIRVAFLELALGLLARGGGIRARRGELGDAMFHPPLPEIRLDVARDGRVFLRLLRFPQPVATRRRSKDQCGETGEEQVLHDAKGKVNGPDWTASESF